MTVDLWGTGAAVLIQYHRGALSVIPGLVSKGRFSPIESGTDPYPVDPADRGSASALSRTLAAPVASALALADELSQRIGPWQR